MSTESLQSIVESGGNPSGDKVTGMSTDEASQKLDVGFRVMDPEKQREIARMGGRERGRQMHEAAKRGESGTARKYWELRYRPTWRVPSAYRHIGNCCLCYLALIFIKC